MCRRDLARAEFFMDSGMKLINQGQDVESQEFGSKWLSELKRLQEESQHPP